MGEKKLVIISFIACFFCITRVINAFTGGGRSSNKINENHDAIQPKLLRVIIKKVESLLVTSRILCEIYKTFTFTIF